jgi:glyoxylase-like metal-dependent hydrolase (beta-lactamase superfamily II)
VADQKTKLYVVSNGYIENDVALNLLLYNQGTIDEPNKPAEWHRVPSISLLISHPKLGWVLVDTGSHKDAMKDRWPEAARKNMPLVRSEEDMLDARLAQMGLGPEDIDLLVLTHLHLDHVGNLDLFCGTLAGSHVIVHEQELKQALFDVFVGPDDMVNGYLKSDFVGLPEIAFDPIGGDVELAEDLHLLWLPGHTPGTLGVMAHLENSGTIIYTSDAVNWQPNYGPPSRLSGVFYDTVAMRESIRRVRWLERRYDAKVIFGHDMEQFKQLRLSPGQYYD